MQAIFVPIECKVTLHYIGLTDIIFLPTLPTHVHSDWPLALPGQSFFQCCAQHLWKVAMLSAVAGILPSIFLSCIKAPVMHLTTLTLRIRKCQQPRVVSVTTHSQSLQLVQALARNLLCLLPMIYVSWLLHKQQLASLGHTEIDLNIPLHIFLVYRLVLWLCSDLGVGVTTALSVSAHMFSTDIQILLPRMSPTYLEIAHHS